MKTEELEALKWWAKNHPNAGYRDWLKIVKGDGK